MGHTSFQMSRRSFIRAGAVGAGSLAFTPAYLKQALAAVTTGAGPYGPIGSFDANGIALPAGFTSREIARANTPVAGSAVPYNWHIFTDGQATFPTITAGAPDGGWILVANSEIPATGGASGIEFGADGATERAYRVLAGTTLNCAGGRTPWGTWLSCEEHDLGLVHECDPTTLNVGVSRPALGTFSHEAACVDPVNGRLYLTEDKPDGCLYRFTPTAYPDLTAGLLEVATGSVPGIVSWQAVPSPNGGPLNPTRNQVAGAVRFNGGEGLWFDEGIVYFTTKGDGHVRTLNVTTNFIESLYDPATVTGGPLAGVDNITVSQSGDIYVCEDGADLDICLITPEMEVTRFLKLNTAVHGAGNENVGVVFSPDGNRMYFGAQRSFGLGAVYEVTGPFRKVAGTRKKPTVKLTAPKSISIRKLLRQGLPAALDISGPVGIVATLSVGSRGKKGKKGKKSRRTTVVVAEARPAVALDGQAALLLKATKRARRVLRGRKSARATLTVTAKDSAGGEIVLSQPIRLTGRKPRKGKKGKQKGAGKR